MKSVKNPTSWMKSFKPKGIADEDLSQELVDWDTPPVYDDDVNEEESIEEPLASDLEEEFEEYGLHPIFNGLYPDEDGQLEDGEPTDDIADSEEGYIAKDEDVDEDLPEAFLSKIERVFVSSLGIRMACRKSKAREKHNKSTQKRGMWGFHNNHQDTSLMKITMIIMGRGLAVKLRRDDWNELTGHPKDRGRDRPNSRTNSLQPGEDDVD
jgi:hypothetical protein